MSPKSHHVVTQLLESLEPRQMLSADLINPKSSSKPAASSEQAVVMKLSTTKAGAQSSSASSSGSGSNLVIETLRARGFNTNAKTSQANASNALKLLADADVLGLKDSDPLVKMLVSMTLEGKLDQTKINAAIEVIRTRGVGTVSGETQPTTSELIRIVLTADDKTIKQLRDQNELALNNVALDQNGVAALFKNSFGVDVTKMKEGRKERLAKALNLIGAAEEIGLEQNDPLVKSFIPGILNGTISGRDFDRAVDSVLNKGIDQQFGAAGNVNFGDLASRAAQSLVAGNLSGFRDFAGQALDAALNGGRNSARFRLDFIGDVQAGTRSESELGGRGIAVSSEPAESEDHDENQAAGSTSGFDDNNGSNGFGLVRTGNSGNESASNNGNSGGSNNGNSGGGNNGNTGNTSTPGSNDSGNSTSANTTTTGAGDTGGNAGNGGGAESNSGSGSQTTATISNIQNHDDGTQTYTMTVTDPDGTTFNVNVKVHEDGKTTTNTDENGNQTESTGNKLPDSAEGKTVVLTDDDGDGNGDSGSVPVKDDDASSSESSAGIPDPDARPRPSEAQLRAAISAMPKYGKPNGAQPENPSGGGDDTSTGVGTGPIRNMKKILLGGDNVEPRTTRSGSLNTTRGPIRAAPENPGGGDGDSWGSGSETGEVPPRPSVA